MYIYILNIHTKKRHIQTWRYRYMIYRDLYGWCLLISKWATFHNFPVEMMSKRAIWWQIPPLNGREVGEYTPKWRPYVRILCTDLGRNNPTRFEMPLFFLFLGRTTTFREDRFTCETKCSCFFLIDHVREIRWQQFGTAGTGVMELDITNIAIEFQS